MYTTVQFEISLWAPLTLSSNMAARSEKARTRHQTNKQHLVVVVVVKMILGHIHPFLYIFQYKMLDIRQRICISQFSNFYLICEAILTSV